MTISNVTFYSSFFFFSECGIWQKNITKLNLDFYLLLLFTWYCKFVIASSCFLLLCFIISEWTWSLLHHWINCLLRTGIEKKVLKPTKIIAKYCITLLLQNSHWLYKVMLLVWVIKDLCPLIKKIIGTCND